MRQTGSRNRTLEEQFERHALRRLRAGIRATGLTALIRERLTHGDFTVDELARDLKADPDKVRNLVQQMHGRTGGVVAIDGTSPRKYGLFGAATTKRARRSARGSNGSGKVAAPITIPQFRWGATRLG